MDAPFIISAHTAVLPSRPGSKSVFDPTAVISSSTLKQFIADPTKTKEAVQKLKEKGFRVSSVGQYLIGFFAARTLFEKEFNIKIIQTEKGVTVEGESTFGFIDIGGSDFANLLSGIAIDQVASELCQEQKLDPTQVCPEELPIKLGISQEELKQYYSTIESQKPVPVAMVDTGFYDHPYFQSQFPKKSIKTILVNEENVSGQIQILRENHEERKNTMELIGQKLIPELFKLKNKTTVEKTKAEILEVFQNGLNDYIGIYNADIKEKSDFDDEAIGKLFQTFDGIESTLSLDLFSIQEDIQKEQEYLDLEMDPSGHGTSVVANFLPIATSSPITMIKSRTTTGADGVVKNIYHNESLKLVLKLNPTPAIFSCSIGTVTQKTPQENVIIDFILSKLIEKEVIVLFAAGNIDHKEKIIYEAQNPEIIVVGGAYKIENQVLASKVGHGYEIADGKRKFIPDVCGWCGPVLDQKNKTKYNIMIPQPGPKWNLATGTSLATPQVAALCTVIKQQFPALKTEDIKKVLWVSANEIQSGKSAQGAEMKDLKNTFSIGTEEYNKPIGIININSALLWAEKVAALSAKSANEKAIDNN